MKHSGGPPGVLMLHAACFMLHSTNMNCLFCKIIAKQIPVDIIYEDEKVVAFLDINPVNPGHLLVVPKVHSENIAVAADDDLIALTLAVKKLAPAVCAATACDGWNLEVNNGNAAGQAIDHTHWHIVPRHKDDGLKHWPGHPYAEGEATKLADKIRKEFLNVKDQTLIVNI
jgi:histidine triad (HIT) family protein